MIIVKSLSEKSSFSQHTNEESDDCTLLRSERLREKHLEPLVCFPASPFFIHNFILCGNHPISFNGLITGSGQGTDIPGEASKRASWGTLYPCGFPQCGPWAHSLSGILHRLPFSNIQGLSQYFQAVRGTLWEDLSTTCKQRNHTAARQGLSPGPDLIRKCLSPGRQGVSTLPGPLLTPSGKGRNFSCVHTSVTFPTPCTQVSPLPDPLLRRDSQSPRLHAAWRKPSMSGHQVGTNRTISPTYDRVFCKGDLSPSPYRLRTIQWASKTLLEEPLFEPLIPQSRFKSCIFLPFGGPHTLENSQVGDIFY